MMTFAEINEAVLRLSDDERLELLHWLLENFDENGQPVSSPEPERVIRHPTLSS